MARRRKGLVAPNGAPLISKPPEPEPIDVDAVRLNTPDDVKRVRRWVLQSGVGQQLIPVRNSEQRIGYIVQPGGAMVGIRADSILFRPTEPFAPFFVAPTEEFTSAYAIEVPDTPT